MVNQEAIAEFKELYLKEYGIQLTDQQATEYSTRLVQLVKTVYGRNFPKLRGIDNGKSKEHD